MIAVYSASSENEANKGYGFYETFGLSVDHFVHGHMGLIGEPRKKARSSSFNCSMKIVDHRFIHPFISCITQPHTACAKTPHNNATYTRNIAQRQTRQEGEGVWHG